MDVDTITVECIGHIQQPTGTVILRVLKQAFRKLSQFGEGIHSQLRESPVGFQRLLPYSRGCFIVLVENQPFSLQLKVIDIARLRNAAHSQDEKEEDDVVWVKLRLEVMCRSVVSTIHPIGEQYQEDINA